MMEILYFSAIFWGNALVAYGAYQAVKRGGHWYHSLLQDWNRKKVSRWLESDEGEWKEAVSKEGLFLNRDDEEEGKVSEGIFVASDEITVFPDIHNKENHSESFDVPKSEDSLHYILRMKRLERDGKLFETS